MRQRIAPEERGTAVAVGALYLLATAAGVTAVIVGAPSEVAQMAGRPGAVLTTALLIAVMAVAVAGVGVMFHPLLAHDADTRTGRGLALGFAAVRIAEGALFLVSAAALVTVLGVSEAAPGAASAEAAALAAVGEALHSFYDYSMVAAQTAFCVSAALLYVLLYLSRRVPRWLSVWGLAATPLMLIAGFTLPFTGDPNSSISTLLYAPMAVQEMVLAGWLLAYGLRPAVASPAVTARAEALWP